MVKGCVCVCAVCLRKCVCPSTNTKQATFQHRNRRNLHTPLRRDIYARFALFQALCLLLTALESVAQQNGDFSVEIRRQKVTTPVCRRRGCLQQGEHIHFPYSICIRVWVPYIYVSTIHKCGKAMKRKQGNATDAPV